MNPVRAATFHFLKIQLHIILPFTPGSSKRSVSFRIPDQNPVYTSPLPKRATCPTYLILLDLITRTVLDVEYRSLSSSVFFSHFPCYLVPLRLKYSQHPILKHPQPTFLPQCEQPSFTPIQNRQNYSAVYLNIYISGQQTGTSVCS